MNGMNATVDEAEGVPGLAHLLEALRELERAALDDVEFQEDLRWQRAMENTNALIKDRNQL